jgi:hypothetical protein
MRAYATNEADSDAAVGWEAESKLALIQNGYKDRSDRSRIGTLPRPHAGLTSRV